MRDKNMDKYLEEIDKGTQKPGTLREMRQGMPSEPIKRPWFGGPMPDKKVPSKAPSGDGMYVRGDIGRMRQDESQKVTRKKLGGRDISNPLRYREPQTAIDAKFGPPDKVC
jgi:hypothetical protein